MLPEYISRNIIFSLILSFILVLIFVICAYVLLDIQFNGYVPSSADWLNEFQSNHPLASFFISLSIMFLAAFVWNARLNNLEVLLKEEFSHIINIVLMGTIVFSAIPSIQLAISLFFIVLAINRLLTINRNSDTFHSVSFDSGLFIGLATFFTFPSIILLIFSWAAMLILSTIRIKEFLWNVLGFVFPYLILYLINLIFEVNLELFPKSYLNDFDVSLNLGLADYGFLLVCVVAIFFGLLILNQKLRRSSVRFQRVISVLNLLFVVMAIYGLILSFLNDWQFILISLVFPVSYYWHCIGVSSSRFFLKTFLYIIWAGLIFINFFNGA